MCAGCDQYKGKIARAVGLLQKDNLDEDVRNFLEELVEDLREEYDRYLEYKAN